MPQVFAPPPHRIYSMRLVGGAVFALQTLKTWAKIIVFPKASNFAIASPVLAIFLGFIACAQKEELL